MVKKKSPASPNLTDCSLQHCIKSPLWCVHVAGNALPFDDPCKVAHVSGHAQDVVEAVGRPAANLVVAVGREEDTVVEW